MENAKGREDGNQRDEMDGSNRRRSSSSSNKIWELKFRAVRIAGEADLPRRRISTGSDILKLKSWVQREGRGWGERREEEEGKGQIDGAPFFPSQKAVRPSRTEIKIFSG